jgi:Xaa-Pro aminopeptidase
VSPDQYDTGMDLRDYFAAMALTTFLIKTKPTDMTKTIAEECYAMADAMMEARKK